ncbi:MAG: acyl-CoA dehydrogenase family protein [Gemmatimonadota bacterium]|nr:acyl-CoA dehydrogenase family protein [Gemmatimonadota bacterium]
MPTPEQLEIQTLAHEFAAGELRPYTYEWDASRSLGDDVFGKLAELGFLGMLVDEEHGGLDFDLVTYLLVLEELAWGDPAVALAVSIHSGPVSGLLRWYGSEEQKGRWLPELASGNTLGAFALSEAGAGSDPGALRTAATADGDGWRLDGEKKWVTNGVRAGLVLTFARTGEDEISTFLVPGEAGGLEPGTRETTMGFRASDTVTLCLEGVQLDAEGLLGERGAGLRYALAALDLGRIGVAVQASGVGRASMEHAARYALEREQFGREIARFGAIQAKLAEMATRVSAGRALAHEAAGVMEALQDTATGVRTGVDGVTARAAMAKLVASEAATWAADEAVQIYGGYGYMRHYPVEKLLRDAKGYEIFEGTNEILRQVIAREVLRAAGD